MSRAVGNFLDLGIDLRGEEEDEELEDVDAESVSDDVETVDQVYSEGVDQGQ